MSDLKSVYCLIISLLSAMNFLFSENKGDISREEIILTLKAADCFKAELDSNEIYWHVYKSDQYFERLNFIFAFAVDKKDWIHIPQIIQIPENYEERFSKVKSELRIQVFDDTGIIRKIIHTQLPDSIQIDNENYVQIHWGKQISDLIVTESGYYFLRNPISVGTSQYAQLIVKISSEGKVERLWGPLGYPKLIEYTDSIFKYWQRGGKLDYLYFTEEGHIGSGSWKCNLVFDRNGKRLKFETIDNANVERNIVQSIAGEIYCLDRRFLAITKFIDKYGKTLSYKVSTFYILSSPFQILESGELIVYRIRKGGVTKRYEPIANRPGLLCVWRDENGVMDPHVHIVKEKYLPFTE